MTSYIDRLERMNAFTEPVTREAIAGLPIPPAARGLDLGCGIGSHTRWLLERAGERARMVGLDRSADHLDAARRASPSSPIRWVQGDLLHLPFEDASFDFIWCADTLWPGVVASPAEVLRDIHRILRPGGFVALWYWTDQALICGHPALEARLRAAFCDAAPYIHGVPPRGQVSRARAWLQSAGFEPVATRTCVRTLTGPLDPSLREGVHDAIDMLYADLRGGLDGPDQDTYRRVAEAGSPEAVGDDPAYFGWVLYTLHVGTR